MITGSDLPIIPKDELWTMPEPDWFKGKRVLELGNKKNTSGCYRDWYVAQGAEYVCTDWNAQDGAVPFDFGKNVETEWPEIIGWADIVTNFGFTEHVFTDQIQAWFNVFAMASKPGCHLSIVLPYPTHWNHHGVYQPTMHWLNQAMEANGFELETIIINEDRKRWVNCIGAQRIYQWNPNEFVYPDPTYTGGKGVYITPPKRRVNPAEKACGVNP